MICFWANQWLFVPLKLFLVLFPSFLYNKIINLAAQQGNKIQSQDELLKRRSAEIQTLKKKIKDDQLKSKKLSSTRGNMRPVKNVDVKNPKIWGDLKSKIQQSIIAKETSQNL